MLKQILFSLLIILSIPCYGQVTPSGTKEAIYTSLKNARSEKQKAGLLLDLSRAYLSSNPDSALYFISQAESSYRKMNDQSGLGYCFLLASSAFSEKGDTLSGRRKAIRAIEIFTANKQNVATADAYTELANYFNEDEHGIPMKISYYKKSLALYRAAGDKAKEAECLYNIAYQRQNNGGYDTAINEFKQVLAIYDAIGHKDRQRIHAMMGSVYNYQGDQSNALKYTLLAIQEGELKKDTSPEMANTYDFIGIIYHDQHEFEKAMFYVRKSLDIALNHRDLSMIPSLIFNIASLHLQLQKPAEALAFLENIRKQYTPTDPPSQVIIATTYMRTLHVLHRYAEAQKYCDQIMRLTDNMSNSLKNAAILMSVIDFSLASGQYDRARKLLSTTEYVYGANFIRGMAANHYQWFRLDSASGHYLAAIQRLQKYKIMNDSVYNIAKLSQLSQLTTQYEAAKKDRNIDLLTRQAALRKALLEKQKITRNVIIGSAIMLLLLLGLVFNRYRWKQRANIEMEARQREIDEKNESLQHLIIEKDDLLVQKEWLLKEVHHRVKNNLQIVMSLLSSQSAYLSSDEAVAAIRDSSHRMHSMSLIHQKLYQADNVSDIDMGNYIHDLTAYLQDCFDSGNRITFELSVDEISLDIGQAVPVGLILNEAISNAVKYAFSDKQKGHILVAFYHTEDGKIRMNIVDDGKGLPADFDINKTRSLGMNLMQGLTRQIGGDFKIENRNGVVVTIEFSPEHIVKPIA